MRMHMAQFYAAS